MFVTITSLTADGDAISSERQMLVSRAMRDLYTVQYSGVRIAFRVDKRGSIGRHLRHDAHI
jgi:hypothetical protein